MGFQLLKSETRKVRGKDAKEAAAKFAGMPKSPTERELRPERVRRLVHILEHRLHLPFQWATVEFDGQTYRMNGQHSSNAVNECERLPEEIVLHLDQYKADDKEGMVELFRQFDQRWSQRSSLDVCGAYKGLVTELGHCDTKVCKVAAEAISWHLKVYDAATGPSGDDVFDLLHNPAYHEFVLWCDRVLSKLTPHITSHKETVAAMYATFQVSQSGAQKFWFDVAGGPDRYTNDAEPGAVLSAELLRSLDDAEFRKTLAPADYFRKAIKAWNAFCKGESIRSLNVSRMKAGQKLAGVCPVMEYTGASEAA